MHRGGRNYVSTSEEASSGFHSQRLQQTVRHLVITTMVGRKVDSFRPTIQDKDNTIKRRRNLLFEMILMRFHAAFMSKEHQIGNMRMVYNSTTARREVRRRSHMTFKQESAFFRTSALGTLSFDRRALLTKDLLRVMRTSHEWRKPLYVLDGLYRCQEFGVEWTYLSFRDVLVSPARPKAASFRKVIKKYIDDVIIRANIQGFYATFDDDVSVAVNALTELLNEIDTTNTYDDVINVVLSHRESQWTERDVAELILLNVLSVVGFTGIALEWVLLDYSMYAPKVKKSHMTYSQGGCLVMESLRLHPPAWKLMRETIGEGSERSEQVFYNISQVHREPKAWVDRNKYRPERWLNIRNPFSLDAYMPFGAGVMQCPARDFAFEYLISTLVHIDKTYTLHGKRSFRHWPYVGILQSPARKSYIQLHQNVGAETSQDPARR